MPRPVRSVRRKAGRSHSGDAGRKLLLHMQRNTPPEKLTKKQKQIWEYMKFHPKEINLSAIARGAGVNRHTAAKHYELIREMAGHG